MLEFTRNQKIVIGLAMLALVVMVLFPPWYPHRGQGQLGEHYAPIWCGARLLGNVPRQRDTNYSMSTRRLNAQFVALVLFTLGALALLRE